MRDGANHYLLRDQLVVDRNCLLLEDNEYFACKKAPQKCKIRPHCLVGGLCFRRWASEPETAESEQPAI